MHSVVCFVKMMIVISSFEKVLFGNANFRLNNVNNEFSLLMEYGILLCFLVKILENIHYICYILEHYRYTMTSCSKIFFRETT